MYSNLDIHRDIRKPRLRWGKRDDDTYPSFAINTPYDRSDEPLTDETDELDIQPEKRKSVRLRFGRSFNTGFEPHIDLNEVFTYSIKKILFDFSSLCEDFLFLHRVNL